MRAPVLAEERRLHELGPRHRARARRLDAQDRQVALASPFAAFQPVVQRTRSDAQQPGSLGLRVHLPVEYGDGAHGHSVTPLLGIRGSLDVMS